MMMLYVLEIYSFFFFWSLNKSEERWLSICSGKKKQACHNSIQEEVLTFPSQHSCKISFQLLLPGASLVAQLVQNLPAMRGDLGSILGLGRSPGEGKGSPLHSLAWRIPWTVQSMGLQSARHNRATFTSLLSLSNP